jgi:hypothetical protein
MPAYAGRIDDVDLSPPGEVGRLFRSHARVLRGKVQGGNLRPVGVQVVDFHDVHLVLLPDGYMDLLEHEVCAAEAQAGEIIVSPSRLEAKIGEECERSLKVGPRGHEGDECRGSGLHDWSPKWIRLERFT